MGVHVHRSERTGTLLQGLATLLTDIPPDPFTPEVVAVPTRGIERFITQSLSLALGTSDGSDGICANVQFPSPASVVNRVVAQASGIDPDDDPWLPQRLVWPVLAVIEDSLDSPWCVPIARHLEQADRRLAVAGRLAGLFDSYAEQRPDMVLAWLAGGDDTPPDLAWQPALWRATRDHLGVPSPAERLLTSLAAVRTDPDLVDLPERLSVFGPSRLPANHLQVLTALGHHRDVHLWLPDPSTALWSDLTHRPDVRRRDDSSASRAFHPLLRSLGRDARELRMRLDPDSDEYLPANLDGDSLLRHLQRQIRDNAALTGAHPDGSVEVHSCHGPARQAEVIREVILGLLQDDPTLQPRDILVMCPDLDVFAPLLSAAFSDADAATLRLRLADRTPEQANDILAGIAALMDLITGRMELSAVLDFMAREPVRDRFGFDDDALERIENLAAQAGIRWGLDDDHRASFKVRVSTGTWAWGVDRLLLGATLSEDGLPLLNGVLPVDDVNSGDVERIGRLAEIVTRLRELREAMLTPQPIGDWVALLTGAIDDLMRVRGEHTWQYANAVAALNALGDNAGTSSARLTLGDIRWLLNDLLTGRPTRTNFRSGHLTVCGLAPMRSVPHRVICLVGMDDASFPRSTIAHGDDVLARDPRIGDRDVRSEDRQVLLDAIMAAEDRLVVTFTGADERTNEPQPACVPLGDLLDTINQMTSGAAQVVTHPLQPFDPRNFTPGALIDGPFSHDAAARDAALRAREPRVPKPSRLISGLEPPEVTDLALRDLIGFLCSPMAAFIRSRLGISLRGWDDPVSEQIPLQLDGLQKWHIGNRSLQLLTRGEPGVRVAQAERARGDLPPGVLGGQTLTEVGRAAMDVATRVAALRTGTPRHVPISLELPNGVRIVGSVSDVFDTAIVRATYSASKPRDDLRLWPDLLAAAAAHPGPWRAHMVTKNGGVSLLAPPEEESIEILRQIVELYLIGMTEPLPLPMACAYSYASRRMEGKRSSVALPAAQFGQWQSTYGADRDEPEVVALYGEKADFQVILSQPPRPSENWFDEETRFGMLARYVWEPILRARARS